MDFVFDVQPGNGQMEQVLELINSKVVSLDNEEIKYNNDLLKSTIELLLIPEMKRDALFNEIFNTIAFGGSFYDGLKVGKPDEFDLNIKLFIPKCKAHNKKHCKCCVRIISCSDAPGFVYFEVKETLNEKFNSFIKEGYVQVNRVIKQWFKGVVNAALNKIKNKFKRRAELDDVEIIERGEEQSQDGSKVHDKSIDGSPKFKSESGPALTLCAHGKFGPINIDLVPAFEFDTENWPQGFRPNTSREKNLFLIVPKKIEGENCERYWRASFQEQEKDIIHNTQRLKPALRLLKKIRSSHHESIPSYALKTIGLWDSFDYNQSLSACFLHLVKTYRNCLHRQEIPYYWKFENNLFNLKNIKSVTLECYHNHIKKILDDLEKEPGNPYLIAKLILKDGTEEYEKVIAEMKANDEKYCISRYDSYADVEPYLHKINTKYLKPVKDKLTIVKSFVQKYLLPRMRRENAIFNKMCQEKINFYDNYFGSRHSIYVVLSLPKCETCHMKNCKCVTIPNSDSESFVFFKIEQDFCDSWNMFASKQYMRGDYVLSWFHHLIQEALEGLNLPYEILSCTVEYNHDGTLNRAPDANNGSALKVKLKGELSVSYFNLVPAFNVSYDRLPNSFRLNPVATKDTIYILPALNGYSDERYWRPCFQDQEQELLKNKGKLKSGLQLLKISRDSHGYWPMSDYALRTMLLWDVQDDKFNFNKSLGDTFMYLIQNYKDKLGEKEVFHYWKKKRLNLLKCTELDEYYEKIKNEISQFKDDYCLHPEFIAKLILGEGTKEYTEFINEVKREDGLSVYQEGKITNKETNFSLDLDSEDEYSYSSARSNSHSAYAFDNHASNSRRSTFRSQTGSTQHYSSYVEAEPFTTFSESRNLASEQQQSTVQNESNMWAIAAGVAGAAAVLGLGIWGASRNNNSRH